MAVSFSIETIDQSDRWYFVPGNPAEFELRVCNTSSMPQNCTFSIEEPIDGGTIEPPTAILQPSEPIVLRVKLHASWSARDGHVVVAVRELGGIILATIVRPITAATVSDCTLSLGWKEPIVANDSLRGFVLQCFIRNIGKHSGAFQPRFSRHPALSFPTMAPSILTPGEAVVIDAPIIWNRSMRDDDGLNHPRMLEVEVLAGGRRRSATTPWETVQLHLRRFLNEQDTEVLVPLRSPRPPFPKGDARQSAPLSDSVTAGGSDAPAASAMFARAEMQPATKSAGPPRNLVPIMFATIGVIAIAIVTLQLLHIRLPGLTPVTTIATTASTLPPIGSNGPPGVKHVPRARAVGTAALLKRITSSSAQSAVTPAVDQATSSYTVPATAHAAAPAVAAVTPAVKDAAMPQRPAPIDRDLVVTLSGVTAWYGHGGRVVHVAWDSTAQAAADVQLLDSRNVIIAERRLSGAASAAVVALPPKFHGDVFVAVTAIGYHGERVVQSGSPQ